jgi:hypothetical protein
VKDNNNTDMGEVICRNELNGHAARRGDMKSKCLILVEKHEENVPRGALELRKVAPPSPTS